MLKKTDGLQRTLSAQETLLRVHHAAQECGVTRVADLTGLDRLGIPVYSAIVPQSADSISVYNGKGLRPIDAKVGALMEAIERQTALRRRLPVVEGSYNQLSQLQRVLNPLSLTEQLHPGYSPESCYSWIAGHDLVSGESVLVPAKYAGYLWDELPHESCFESVNSNGLASGNCTKEAICHALCEVVERDAWSMAELAASVMPRARRAFIYGADSADGPDDLEIYPCLEFSDDGLLASFHSAGLYPVVRDITSELRIPVIIASVADESVPGFPMAHSGLGCHPDANVALRRALTELAQSRAVDIQGVREDLTPPEGAEVMFSLHTRRVSAIRRDTWYLGLSKRRRTLAELPSLVNDDIESDLNHIVSRLAACGMNEVIVVDFTPPGAPFAVVRVIVPGIEFWATDRGRIGPRAQRFWRENV